MTGADSPEPKRKADVIYFLARRRTTTTESRWSMSIEGLTAIIADVSTLRALYEKYQRQPPESAPQSLSWLYEKHRDGQAELIKRLAHRVQLLGGSHRVESADIARMTSISRGPPEAESAAAQIRRLLRAHDTIIRKAHSVALKAWELGDPRTSDLLSSHFLRTQELQAWSLSDYFAEYTGSDLRPPLQK